MYKGGNMAKNYDEAGSDDLDKIIELAQQKAQWEKKKRMLPIETQIEIK